MQRSATGRTEAAAHKITSVRVRAAATALSIGLLLSGCVSYPTTEPAAARAYALQKQGASGPVDCSKAKCIALTFDGGPGPYTQKLLDILKEKRALATFFLLGRKHIERYPDIVRRIADEGHEVANHTWTHPRLPDIDATAAREDIERAQREIAKITGTKPTLMRPPQGRTDKKVSAICKELGLAQVLWSTTAKDYATNNSELIKKRTLSQIKRDGVILLHDIYRGTVPAIPDLIDELRKRGYTLVTVPQLMAPAMPEPGVVYKP